jgi:DNA-binding SARP family transcriptional activator/tetratricopeptide (TPR) repeat protein
MTVRGQATEPVRFRVLGPLEADRAGCALSLGPPKQRLFLAVLLSRPQQRVSADHLVEALWQGAPPRSAPENLRVYLHGLRAALGAAAIRGSGRNGYVLVAEPEQLDSAEFLDIAARGRIALGAGSVSAGRDLIGRALDLWRGSAYADFVDVGALAAERQRLDAHRLSSVEHRIDGDLALGRHADVVAELTALVVEHPFRERFHAQLMIALYRCGRQVDALAVYRQLQRLLATELGLEPQPELTELHAAMLRGEVSDAARGDPLTISAAARVVPSQLPPAAALFTGRARELDRLTEILGDRVATGTPVVIAAIGGIGGIGKTWLALHWAHRHLDRFPDGTLFVNLRGYDRSSRPLSSSEVVRGFLAALGVSSSSMPAEVDAQIGLYRSLVAGRRMLMVLDNARDADQIADLLPGCGCATVLVTSRNRLTGLVVGRGAVPLSLDVLDDTDARELLRSRLGNEVIETHDGAVDALIRACGGLPLALAVIAARAELQPGVSLSEMAAEVLEESNRLNALDEGDELASVRAVLSWSVAALTDRQAAMFGLLGLVRGQDIGTVAAAALSGRPRLEAETLLRHLERHSLISQPAPGRWQLHDLVKLYAAEEARRAGADERTALRRLVDHYNHTAYAADRLLNPHRPELTLRKPVPGAVTDPPVDAGGAMRWFEAERANMRAIQQIAHEHGWMEAAWQLARSLDTFYWRRHHNHDRYAAWRVGVAAAEKLGDPGTIARAARLYGDACIRADRYDEGMAQLDRALRLGEQHEDHADVVLTLTALGHACAARGDHEAALHHALRSLALARTLGEPVKEADRLNAVGWYTMLLGRTEQARGHLDAALTLARRHGHLDIEAATLDSLATLAARTGQYEAALTRYEELLPIFTELGDDYYLAENWQHIGDMRAELGHSAAARTAWARALELYEEQHRPAAAIEVRQRLDGLSIA